VIYAKAIAHGIVTGLMAPVVLIALLAWAGVDSGALGGAALIPGTLVSRADVVLPVVVVLGFAVGFARTLWRARAKTQTR
jgi:hypothetical protein